MPQYSGNSEYDMMPTYMQDADICRKDSEGDDLAKSRHIVQRSSVNGTALVLPTGRFGNQMAGQSKLLIDRVLANEMHAGLSVVHRRRY
jgi:hypothetical protein